MKKQITTGIAFALCYVAFAQAPDTLKSKNSKNNIPIARPLFGTDAETKQRDENEVVVMDLNELLIADSTLTSLGTKQIIRTDSIQVVSLGDAYPRQTSQAETWRNSKDHKSLVIANTNETEELSWKRLEILSKNKEQSNRGFTNTLYVEDYSHEGISVFLGGNLKSVRKAWKAYLYQTNQLKLKPKRWEGMLNRKKVSYHKASVVSLTNVSNRIGDLITVFQQEKGLVKMTVIYKLGQNVSINKENFPEENQRLTEYIEHFSHVNFPDYYLENIENLKQAIKAVNQELKKETKQLDKLQNELKHAAQKNKMNANSAYVLEEQKMLLKALALEKSFYELRIIQYKNKNSELRLQSVD